MLRNGNYCVLRLASRIVPQRLGLCLIFLLLIAVEQAFAERPTAGNLIASVNEFTGLSDAPTYVAEYTTDGTRMQIIADVPEPGSNQTPSTESARDLVMGVNGAIHVYNGTFDPFLATVDSNTGNWTQQTFPGWSTTGNIRYGGLDRAGRFIYATDMETAAAGNPRGIVRFDLSGGSAQRFATEIDPIDVVIGPGNLIYALDAFQVRLYDPDTLASLGTVSLDFYNIHGAIDVAEDGTIFAASDGLITRYSAAGAVLDSLTITNAFFTDIDISPTGQIALGTADDGNIVLTDLDLDAFTSFRATDSTSGGEVWVAWVPEPSTFGMLALGGVAALALRRKGGRGC